MSTLRQTAANRANSQYSTGPKTEAGKAASAQNNRRYGFTGKFFLLEWESEDAYNVLVEEIGAQYQPVTSFEERLVEKIAQHYWLVQRALALQFSCFHPSEPLLRDEKHHALMLRYQTTQDRAFHAASATLVKLQDQRRKAEIGFESQKRAQAAELRRVATETRKENEEIRRAAAETRRRELHEESLSLLEARVEHQELLNAALKGSAPVPKTSDEEISIRQNAV